MAADSTTKTRKSTLTLLAGVLLLVLGGWVIWKTAQPDPEPEPTQVADSKRPASSDRPDRPKQQDRGGNRSADGDDHQVRPRPSVPVSPTPGGPSPEPVGPAFPIVTPGVPAPTGLDDLPPDMRAGIENPPPFVRKAIENPPPQATILPPETEEEDPESEEEEGE